MNRNITLILLIITANLKSQTDSMFLEKFLQGINHKKINLVDSLSKYDFSELWYKDSNPVYGVIGDDYNRLYVKIISVVRNEENQREYFVYGKRKFNDSIRSFQGKIKLERIHKLSNPNYDLGDILKEKKIQMFAFIIADFVFFEENTEESKYKMKGKLFTKWYLSDDNKIKYNHFGLMDKFYFNNAFIGNRISSHDSISTRVKWGDHMPPDSEEFNQIDIEFFRPKPEFKNKGWSDLFPDPNNKGGIQTNYDDNWWKGN